MIEEARADFDAGIDFGIGKAKGGGNAPGTVDTPLLPLTAGCPETPRFCAPIAKGCPCPTTPVADDGEVIVAGPVRCNVTTGGGTCADAAAANGCGSSISRDIS